MNIEVVALVHIAVMVYALRMVCRYDARRPSADQRRAVRHTTWIALTMFAVAAVLAVGSGDQRYVITRETWHAGLVASAVAVGLAVQALTGRRR